MLIRYSKWSLCLKLRRQVDNGPALVSASREVLVAASPPGRSDDCRLLYILIKSLRKSNVFEISVYFSPSDLAMRDDPLNDEIILLNSFTTSVISVCGIKREYLSRIGLISLISFERLSPKLPTMSSASLFIKYSGLVIAVAVIKMTTVAKAKPAAPTTIENSMACLLSRLDIVVDFSHVVKDIGLIRRNNGEKYGAVRRIVLVWNGRNRIRGHHKAVSS